MSYQIFQYTNGGIDMKKKTMAMVLSFSMVFTGLGMEAAPRKGSSSK